MSEQVFHSRSEWWWFVVVWTIVFFVGVVGAFADFTWKLSHQAPAPSSILPLPTPTPVQLDSHWSAPVTTANSVWIYDRQSGSILYEKNARVATAAASLAKLMTAMVARDLYPSDQIVTIGSAAAVIGNRAKFLRRDEFSVQDLLKSMLIFSANDAAQALAAADPSGISHFLQQMNQRAQLWHLTNTHFDNPTGLDAPGQYSSAEDLGHIADRTLRDDFLAQTVASTTAKVTELRTRRQDIVYSTNSLLRRSSRIQGMKTGTTELAGENLIIRYVRPAGEPLLMENTASFAAFLRQIQSSSPSAQPQPSTSLDPQSSFPLDVIVVILGSQHRFDEAWQLVKWVDIAARLVPAAENR